MAILRGGDKVFAIRFTDDDEAETLRVLYQTDGGRTISADETDIATKDIDGVDYGAITEEINFDGLVGVDDPALDRIKSELRAKNFVEILEIDINTLIADVGNYMISNLDFGYPDKESATYSFTAKLTGRLTEETLTVAPDGATDI